jgi:VIT1/CCC1 family predicted Fe2+/Mn2+ transporter
MVVCPYVRMKALKTKNCFHCDKPVPEEARRCPECGGRLGTTADFAVMLFLPLGVLLGIVIILGAGEDATALVVGGVVLGVSLGIVAWGLWRIRKGERRSGYGKGPSAPLKTGKSQ